MKNNLLFHLIGLIFPARCPVCSEIVQRQDFLCEKCQKEVERIKNPCLGCGREISQCACGKKQTPLNLAAPFAYKDSVAQAIHRFKFQEERGLASYFAKEMAETVGREFKDTRFDIVTCVPQTKRRLRERGYNQSAVLAKETAKRLGTPFSDRLLIKTRETASQHELKAKERFENLKNAFEAPSPNEIKGKTILLCDDIKTTGATLRECRSTLLKAGAKEVYCVAIAVVPEKILME